MNKFEFEEISKVLKNLVLSWNESSVYFVGGCVRDLILGWPIKDIDLCVDCENGAELFCDFLKNNYKSITSGFTIYPRFGTSKFTLNTRYGKYEIECVMPRTETYKAGPRKPDSVSFASIKEDSMRRDFCCNALYKNVVTGELLDPTGKGLNDLNNHILRTPIDAKLTFKDDPLRMLRAIRFQYQKGFKLVDNLRNNLAPNPEYYKLSMERVKSEIDKILMTQNAADAIRDLQGYGLLSYIIPELSEAWGFDQNSKYHNLNLSDHLLSVLEKSIPAGNLLVRWAALLHDISKYKYFEVINGKNTYHGHELSSADITKNIMIRLKTPNYDIDKICKLITNHMIIKQFWDGQEYTGKNKTTRKIMRVLGDDLEDELILINADNLSHAPEFCLSGQTQSFKEKIKSLLSENITTLLQPVSGKEIMEELGIGTGPEVGKIKNLFQEWFDEDNTLTKEKLFEKYRQN